MDAAGVDAAVVVQEYLDGEQNDYCLDVAQRYPDRFFCALPTGLFQSGERSKRKQWLFSTAVFEGLKLSAMHLGDVVDLDDKRLMPIYRHMERKSFVLAVDLASESTQVKQMRNILEQCPRLPVAIGHFGMVSRAGWPEQLELCRFPKVFIELGGIVWLYRNEGYPFPAAIDAIRKSD